MGVLGHPLSVPKIISSRSNDAGPTEWVKRPSPRVVGPLDQGKNPCPTISACASHCTSRQHSAHGTEEREVLYPWHPWSASSRARISCGRSCTPPKPLPTVDQRRGDSRTLAGAPRRAAMDAGWRDRRRGFGWCRHRHAYRRSATRSSVRGGGKHSRRQEGRGPTGLGQPGKRDGRSAGGCRTTTRLIAADSATARRAGP